MSLPIVDFDAHPAYRDFTPHVERRADHSREWEREFEHSLNAWKDYEKFWNYPSENSMEGASEIYRKLFRDGAVGIRLAESVVSDLRAASSSYLEGIRTGLSTDRRDQVTRSKIRLSMEEFRERKDAGLQKAIMALLEETDFVTLTGRYLGVQSVQLSYIHFKITDQSTSIASGTKHVFDDASLPDPRTSYLHVDTTPFHLKAIIYLSEVRDLPDGPFQYVLGTNRGSRTGFKEYITRLATEHYVSSRDWEGRQRLMHLTPEFRQRLDFGSDLVEGSAVAREFLRKEHTFTSAEADAIIFDPLGVHRGARVEVGERAILQLTLSGVLPERSA
jgi:hypothetical protein